MATNTVWKRLTVVPSVLSPALDNLTPPLPTFTGEPIVLRFRPSLTAHRGKLLSCAPQGQPVHAGSSLRDREIVLDAHLLRRRPELARILVHELFHFAWAKLSNANRADYEDVLHQERRLGARGELGWSAEWRRRRLRPEDVRNRTRTWREYVCESFCDTAAFLHSGVILHPEFTLGASYTRRRAEAFRHLVDPAGVSL